MRNHTPGVSRLRAAGAALVCALALGAAGAQHAEAKPSAPKPAKAPREFFGVVATSVHSSDLPRMKQNGVGTLRVLMYWPSIETAPDRYDWSIYDGIIGHAAARGIRVMPTLYGTPSWANLLAGNRTCGATCAPVERMTRQAFADFARAAAERYGPNGTFWRAPEQWCPIKALCPDHGAPCGCSTSLPVIRWQIWNEENSSKYFLPRPDPAAYAHIVQAVGGAIRSYDPNAEIILGGMWGPPRSKAVTPTIRYLKRFYKVTGIRQAFDSVGVHPYSAQLNGVISQTRRVRDLLRKKDPQAKIWITELGWASGGPRKSGLVKTRKAQARLLRDSFEFLIRKRRAWGINGITWYTWRDAGPGEDDCVWCAKAGLRTVKGGKKPAARIFKKLSRGR